MGNCAAHEPGAAPAAAAPQPPQRLATYRKRQAGGTRQQLFEAAERGDVEGVERLCTNHCFSGITENAEGVSLLHVAASKGHAETVRFLLSRAKNDLQLNEIGCTAMHVACRHGHVGLAVELGEEYPSLLVVRSTNRTTPLHQAVLGRQTSVTEHLLAEGVQVNCFDKNKRSPLHYAASQGLEGDCDLLLTAGADYMQRDGEGQTPWDLARANQHLHIVRVLEAMEATRLAQPTFAPLRKANSADRKLMMRFAEIEVEAVRAYDQCEDEIEDAASASTSTNSSATALGDSTLLDTTVSEHGSTEH